MSFMTKDIATAFKVAGKPDHYAGVLLEESLRLRIQRYLQGEIDMAIGAAEEAGATDEMEQAYLEGWTNALRNVLIDLEHT